MEKTIVVDETMHLCYRCMNYGQYPCCKEVSEIRYGKGKNQYKIVECNNFDK